MKRIVVTIAATLLFITSITKAHGQEKRLRRDQLPADVEKTVAAESEGATIKGFSTEVENGRRLYEVELIADGVHKDITMDRNGVIVEVEQEVTIDSLPANVQQGLRQAAGTGTIKMIESLTKNGKLVAYEAHVNRGNKRFEIQVGPNGEKLKKPE